MARPGGVNEPISNFSLVEQDIQVKTLPPSPQQPF